MTPDDATSTGADLVLHQSADFSPAEGIHIVVALAHPQSGIDSPTEGPLLSIYGDLETEDPQTAARLAERLAEACATLAAAAGAVDRMAQLDRSASAVPCPMPRMVVR